MFRPSGSIGLLHDPVTWYKITHAGYQVAQWDFQNKGRSRWIGTSGIVLEVSLCNLLTSMCDLKSKSLILYQVTGSCKGPIVQNTFLNYMTNFHPFGTICHFKYLFFSGSVSFLCCRSECLE